jgi:SAM domain (Sterile alpha motif)
VPEIAEWLDKLGMTEYAQRFAENRIDFSVLTNAGEWRFIQIVRGNYIEANETANELVALAGETGTSFWKARGMLEQGCALAVIGKAADAVRLITLGLDEWRTTGTTL